MNGFYMFIAVVSLISILITYCLGRFFKSRSVVKYIPAIISALAVLGFYIKFRFFSSGTGFEDLGYVVLALIAGIVLLVSLITALTMEVINRWKR
ncbi:MAG: hypothetical protein ACYDG2_15490 [Ruminiclostridium sp.]